MDALLERDFVRGGEAAQRHFLFLQGPASPFFSRLAEALCVRGHRVEKIHFNLGDRLFWRGSAVSYRGRFSRWTAYLAQRFAEEAFTDLVLFGDCRSYHRAAIEMARARGMAIHVFEEGYLRPHWVTLERGGVNGFSQLPDTPADIRRLAAAADDLPPVQKAGSGLRNRVAWDIAYNLTTSFGRPAFPFYRHHRPWPVLLEYACWLKRLALMPLEKRRSRSTLSRLATSEPGFFIFPLQLDSDFQIRVHSDVQSMEQALQVIVRSFAAHAPLTDQLVVKSHPLDNGLVDRRRQCRRIAQAAGVEDRVLFIDGGSLARLSRDAKGLVTVNSTSGMVALEQQRPVAVLGRAIYHMEGLTHQGSLDTFWASPKRPDPDLLADFIRVLKQKALVHGSFFTEAGLASAVEDSVARMEQVVPHLLPAEETEPRLAAQSQIAAAGAVFAE